jgi:hypothetical protein
MRFLRLNTHCGVDSGTFSAHTLGKIAAIIKITAPKGQSAGGFFAVTGWYSQGGWRHHRSSQTQSHQVGYNGGFFPQPSNHE